MIHLTLALCLVAADGAEDVPAPAAALSLLREAQASETVDMRALHVALADCGADAVPVLFAVYDLGILPPEQMDGRPVALDADLRGALWGAFSSLPMPAVRLHLENIATRGSSESTRITAIRLVGGLGKPSDLLLLDRLATPAPGSAPSAEVRAAFRRALALVLERDPAGIQWTHELFVRTHAALRPEVLATIARSNAADRLSVLAGLLGRVPSAEAQILREITNLARAGRCPADEFVRGNVRMVLDATDPTLVRAAAEATGALEDDDAIPRLLELFAASKDATRAAFRGALASIATHDVGEDPAHWSVWYDAEMRWWREDSRDVLGDLRASDPGTVAAAITTVSQHRLYRRELAEALIEVLDRKEATLRRLACVALGALRSSRVRLELLPLLNDPSVEVRDAARAAMSRLSTRVVSRSHL